MVPIGFAVDSATEMEGRLGGRGYTRGLQKTMTKMVIMLLRVGGRSRPLPLTLPISQEWGTARQRIYLRQRARRRI